MKNTSQPSWIEPKSLAPWIRTNLTARYLGGLGLLALLMISSEIYVQNILQQYEAIHEVSNVLYNRIQTDRWMFRTLEQIDAATTKADRIREIREFGNILNALEDNRKKLIHAAKQVNNLPLGTYLDKITIDQAALSRALDDLFRSLDYPDATRRSILEIVTEAQNNSAQSADLLSSLRNYSTQRLNRLRNVERAIFLFILLTLALEALFVFRPAVRTLSESVARLEKTQNELSFEKNKAEQAAGIRSEFIGRMSHEIRNPMNTVLGMAELLNETPLSAEQAKFVQVMKRSGKTLLDFMNDILDFSKLGAGEIDFEKREVNLLMLIEAVSDLISPQAFERGIEFFLDIDPGIPRRLWGDRRRIQQVLINLLQNALKFTDRGFISLKVEFDPGTEFLTFSVIDTGIGIPEEAKSKVFDSFYQVSTGRRRKAGGAGLGLSISKMLVEKMGGSIGVESEFGKGSTFFFKLKPEFVTFSNTVEFSSDIRRQVWVNLRNPLVAKPVIRYLNSIAWASDVVHDPSKVDLILTDDIELAKRHRDRSIVAVPIAGAEETIQNCKLARLQMIFLPIKPSELEEILRGETKRDNIERARSQLILETHKPLKGRLLIVDDSPDNHFVLKAFVGKENFRIDSAYNGQEAVDLIRSGCVYDVILMDVQMPVLDGYEATRIIRKIERERHLNPTPIVIVTALDDEAERELAHVSGCTDRLVKPVSQASLVSVIRSALKAKTDDTIVHFLKKKTEETAMSDLSEVHADLRKLIPGYIANRSQEIEQMIQWQKQRDFERIQASAHKIRGNAATFGFARLGKLAEEIESHCKVRNYDPIQMLLVEMKQELETTGSALKKELDSQIIT